MAHLICRLPCALKALLRNCVETARWLCNGHFVMRKEVRENSWAHSEDAAFCDGRGNACLVMTIDYFMNHIFREHMQGADNLANLGTDGQRKITIEGTQNAE